MCAIEQSVYKLIQFFVLLQYSVSLTLVETISLLAQIINNSNTKLNNRWDYFDRYIVSCFHRVFNHVQFCVIRLRLSKRLFYNGKMGTNRLVRKKLR